MDPDFIGKEKIASLLPMKTCIEVMETMFRSLAGGGCLQPLRSLMWLPDKSGLLGMMPAYAGEMAMMGVKVISVFHGNKEAGIPSHQGVVILMDSRHGRPLMILDAEEITAIRTAAASAVATRLLSNPDSSTLAILGSGEQAQRHIEAIQLVRDIRQIRVWSRNYEHAAVLARAVEHRYKVDTRVHKQAAEAVSQADIICAVTASGQPVLKGEWIAEGAHINAVGACTPAARELDGLAVQRSKLYTDNYQSLLAEAGDFIIAKKEDLITDDHVKGEISEVLARVKRGRETTGEITLFKSLGIAMEDLYAASHIYFKLYPR